MGKFSNCILISDFDQTMTNHLGEIPPENLDAVRFFMEEGGIFTICTGRGLPMARNRFAEVPINAPFLACNGAVCYDLSEEKIIFSSPLPDNCLSLMKYCVETYPDLRLEINCLDKHYIFHKDDIRDEYLRKQGTDFEYADWEHIPTSRLKFAIYRLRALQRQLVFVDSLDSEFQALAKDINQRGVGYCYAINSVPGLVEVQAAEVSKGLAARELARQMGRNVLICAGDSFNDVSMLDEADLSFIPSDCDQRVKGRGYIETSSCDDGTLAGVIEILKTKL